MWGTTLHWISVRLVNNIWSVVIYKYNIIHLIHGCLYCINECKVSLNMYDFKICRNDPINLKWYEYVIHQYINILNHMKCIHSPWHGKIILLNFNKMKYYKKYAEIYQVHHNSNQYKSIITRSHDKRYIDFFTKLELRIWMQCVRKRDLQYNRQ